MTRWPTAPAATRPWCTMMVTAGRTVLFSATIVALSMAVMVLFPMHFLKSFALRGRRHRRLRRTRRALRHARGDRAARRSTGRVQLSRLVGRILLGPPVDAPSITFLYRWTRPVMRRALPLGVAVVALLLLLGAPFLGVKWGFPDDRVLPASASAHQVGDQLRDGVRRHCRDRGHRRHARRRRADRCRRRPLPTDLAGCPTSLGVSPPDHRW